MNFEELFSSAISGSATGRKVLKNGVAWIIIQHVAGELYMAIQAGTKPPVPVMVIRTNPSEWLK